MADRLTQLQDAVDQLAQQFVASIYYTHKHHNLQTLSSTDTIRQDKKSGEGAAPQDVEPHPPEVFQAGQRELAQDLILKEQQIEYLISVLPGLESSEKDQEDTIRRLQMELENAIRRHKEAINERQAALEKLETVIRNIKRP